MVVYYLDTSAILKRYKTEKGTDVVDKLYASDEAFLVTSHFSCLEVESVAAKAHKGHIPGYALDQLGYAILLSAFASDLGDRLYVVPVASGLVNEAIEAARSHAVRAPDAIHVASASAVKKSVSEDFVFVSSDRELLSAARVSGLMTLDPESSDAMDTLKKLK